MCDPLPNSDFQFVNATISNPRVPEDKAVRTLIRKQAMKQASAARRRQGNYGKHNLRQYPVLYRDVAPRPTEVITCSENAYRHVENGHCRRNERQNAGSEGARSGSSLQSLVNRSLIKPRLPSGLSRQGYEAAATGYDFDVVDLSRLASLHLGRFAGKTLSADPSQLPSLLRKRQSSYLTYLPSRYEHSPCLKDAIDCIIARVRSILAPDDKKLRSSVVPLYVKALKSLQNALDSPVQCYEPEVLCAIEILALYEVIHPKRLPFGDQLLTEFHKAPKPFQHCSLDSSCGRRCAGHSAART
jgi:hypothetical protein